MRLRSGSRWQKGSRRVHKIPDQGAVKGATNFIKGMLPGQFASGKDASRSAVNLGKWRPAIKGEIGHEQRRWVPISAKTITEKTPFIARRQVLQIKGGKSVEKLVAERRSLKSEAVREAYAFKRREVADKKREYENEPIKDIRWFERFKAERRDALEKRTRDRASDEDYARAQVFGGKHADLDEDFMKYISSPRKKRSTRRKLDAKGRNVQDMKRAKFAFPEESSVDENQSTRKNMVSALPLSLL